MQPLQDRSELIALVGRRTKIPAVRRACVTGKVENLGAFSWFPPDGWCGWALRVTAQHGTEFLIRVVPRTHHYDYRVLALEYIPWMKWAGDMTAADNYLYRGDHPAEYAKRRDQELGL